MGKERPPRAPYGGSEVVPEGRAPRPCTQHPCSSSKSSASHRCHHGRSAHRETQRLNPRGLSIGGPNLSLVTRSSERMKRSGPEKGFSPNAIRIQGRQTCILPRRAPRIIAHHINVQKSRYYTSLAPGIINDGQQGCPAAPPGRLNTVRSRALRALTLLFSLSADGLRMLIFPIFYIKQQKISPHLK